MELVLHFDGAVEPINPGGTGSWSWILAAADDARQLHFDSGALPAAPSVTNNLAEYTGLGKGLHAVHALMKTQAPTVEGASKLSIYGDSQLVIKQVNLAWACNAPHLAKLRDRCRELLEQIGLPWSASWVPRDRNSAADALTITAWEAATGKPFPVRTKRK